MRDNKNDGRWRLLRRDEVERPLTPEQRLRERREGFVRLFAVAVILVLLALITIPTFKQIRREARREGMGDRSSAEWGDGGTRR